MAPVVEVVQHSDGHGDMYMRPFKSIRLSFRPICYPSYPIPFRTSCPLPHGTRCVTGYYHG